MDLQEHVSQADSAEIDTDTCIAVLRLAADIAADIDSLLARRVRELAKRLAKAQHEGRAYRP